MIGLAHLVVAPVDYGENMRVLVNELHSAIQAKSEISGGQEREENRA
jgi:hypothetical protein